MTSQRSVRTNAVAIPLFLVLAGAEFFEAVAKQADWSWVTGIVFLYLVLLCVLDLRKARRP